MQSLVFCILILSIEYSVGRYLDDSDPNTIRQQVVMPLQEYVSTTPEDVYKELDSCNEYPPASCIKHFHPLPRYLHRSPFNLRSEQDFNLVCNSYKQALQCVKKWMSQCRPQPDSRQFIDQMLELLGQCDNQQVRRDSIVALECGRRMGSVHERCIQETRFIPQLKNLSPERLVRGEPNSVRDLCCGMKYHQACSMDQVQERCGQEAYEANQRLESIVFQGFNCDAYPDSECPQILP